MKITQKIIFTDESIKPYRVYKGVPIARTGVQKYLESELFPNGSNTKIIDIHRPIDEVRKLASNSRNIPIVVNHPNEDVKFNDNNEIIGIAINPKFEDSLLKADLVFYKKPKFEQLSLGYDANIRTIDGKLTVTDIDINHLALVSNGRCGNICSINNKLKDGDKMATIVINDSAFEVDDAVATAFEQAKETNNALKAKNETAFKDGIEYAKEYINIKSIADKRGVRTDDKDSLLDIKRAIVKDSGITISDDAKEELLDGVILTLKSDSSRNSITDSNKEFDFSKLVIGGD